MLFLMLQTIYKIEQQVHNSERCSHSYSKENKERPLEQTFGWDWYKLLRRNPQKVFKRTYKSIKQQLPRKCSVKEAQEFDKLTPEESKKRLLVLIKLMDLNKDGFVDRHELKAWILRSFKKLGEEEAADRLEEIDMDGDGVVTWKEYLKDSFSMEDEDEKKELIDFDSYDEEKEMITSDKELFKAADLNKDGVLDAKEYVLFYSPEEHPEMLPIVLEHTLREKDANHNGEIDFGEFIGNTGEKHNREWLIEEKERFDHLDDNKDGLLTGNEVLNWVVPNSETIAKDEVDHLFVSTDEDHDDRLSFLEILANYDTFVGSEATDYGDHLQNINHFDDEL
ncbi:reticulocalbin-2 isoform X2 [Eurosta solidaginis]|uniref:reticulocalbin-2 isoform X2 n=1 Tax=Eurosta solidaginis TaxID=178769 RepID=UPI0035315732